MTVHFLSFNHVYLHCFVVHYCYTFHLFGNFLGIIRMLAVIYYYIIIDIIDQIICV